jgi:serine/threonine protein kinase
MSATVEDDGSNGDATTSPEPPANASQCAASQEGKSGESEFQVGYLLGGRYELVQILGSGGMGVVWRAKTAHADFAIKLIDPKLLENSWITARFEKERTALFSCRNIPNVAGLIDFIQDSSRMAMVMQFVDGNDLQWHIDQRKEFAERHSAKPLFSQDEFVRMATSLCTSLQEIHRRHIVHRDIKPRNIMISRIDSVPYWTDFGIAKVIDPSAPAKMVKAQPGTKGYMAPEQLDGYEASFGSDQWSLAATLYAVLVGVPPLLGAVRSGKLSLEHSQSLGVFADPIHRALRPEPTHRFESVAEFHKALLQAAAKKKAHVTANGGVDPSGMISGQKLFIDEGHSRAHLTSLFALKAALLKHIVRLDIQDSSLDDIDIRELLGALPSLKVLNLQSCPELSISAIRELLNRSTFETLRIGNCGRMTPESFGRELTDKVKWVAISNKRG